MSPISRAAVPVRPLPTPSQIRDLTLFLAANIGVSQADKDHEKAAGYQAMLDTVHALAERTVDLSSVNRVVVVTARGRAYDKSALYADGCAVAVQDDGRTLKLFPASESRSASFL
jgi:hypothetical protein